MALENAPKCLYTVARRGGRMRASSNRFEPPCGSLRLCMESACNRPLLLRAALSAGAFQRSVRRKTLAAFESPLVGREGVFA